MWIQIFLLNTFIGVLLIEWAWKKTKPLRQRKPELEAQYPAFARFDKWNKSIYYLGAPMIIPKVILAVITFLIIWTSMSLITLGQKYDDFNAVHGWRATLAKLVGKFAGRALLILVGLQITYEEIDFDYTPYLGKDYKKNQKLPPHTPSAIVGTGHSSVVDNMTMLRRYGCTFVAKESLRKYPILGTCLTGQGMIFVNRGGTEEERQRNIDVIVRRQQLCEERGDYVLQCIFAEGTTHNNKFTLPLKRGAFIAERSLLPVCVDFKSDQIYPFHDTKYLTQLLILKVALFFQIKCIVKELPVFLPNEYLFETHKDKGKERWEIYAWAIRDALSIANKKPKLDISLSTKLEFETQLGYRKPIKQE
ncbi:UNKNOWN [Stylonychia lemnae]|uniref:Phospholipid/glycerol acyltransferase domain-containing protein n=1 Tax=Stylonychia lemnae TaxID=5949 RepID=A0A078B9V6_STYLE|nr:UNKNOWN [Stylonychia lemnae]|eukprot:CDW90333.1 UNKNOWN [Stylonychia lemnae]